jgi:DNA-binding LytR/AlgR family response regulator
MPLPLKIAVCEDSYEDAARLSALIGQSGLPAKTESFSSGEAFLAAFSKGKYHLIFLDIYMGGINGIETAENIRETDKNVMLAFTTRSLDHTLESYRLNAYKYLVKPADSAEVAETLELALAKRERLSADVLTVPAGGETMKIPFDELYYAEVYDHKCFLHTDTGTLGINIALDELDRLLPPPRFLRCHQSYVVNLDYVKNIEYVDGSGNAFIMANGGRAYIRVKEFRKMKTAYEQRLFQRAREGRYR